MRSLLAITIAGLAIAGMAGASSCAELLAKGQAILDNRPERFLGDSDSEGRPLTQSARRHLKETRVALETWDRAQERCGVEADRARSPREAARLISLRYWIKAEALSVQQRRDDACETLAAGVQAVTSVEERSPHLARLYRDLGHCVTEYDPKRGVALMEEGLDIAIEAWGKRDARVVENMIHLAVALPYSVAPYGNLDAVSGPEVGKVKLRVAELYRSAWEIVQEDPSASTKLIGDAAAYYQTWLRENGEDDSAAKELENLLIQKRLPAQE